MRVLEAQKEKALAALEDKFHEEVNQALGATITPIYNTIILIFAAVFAYFIAISENQCYAKGDDAYGIQYENTEDVSNQFYLLSQLGVAVLVLSAIMYHLQSR